MDYFNLDKHHWEEVPQSVSKSYFRQTLFSLTLSLILLLSFGLSFAKVDSEKMKAQTDGKQQEQGKQDPEKEKSSLDSFILRASEKNVELAGKIIMWSSLILGVFAACVGVAGWIGSRRFKQIDETAKEMATLLTKMQQELTEMQRLRNESQTEIIKLKDRIENDSKQFLEIIYSMQQGESLIENGQLDDAIHIFGRILLKQPNSPEAYFMIGNAFSLKGDYKNAIFHFEKAIELDPNNASFYYELGKVYRRNNQYDKLIENLGKSLKINPTSSRAAANIGYTYLLNGDISSAVQWFEKAISLDTTYAHPYLCIAMINYHNGNYAEAKRYYDVAKILLESLPIVGKKQRFWDIYHLAEIYMVSGEIEKAKEYYKTAIHMNSAKEVIHSISYRLELLRTSSTPPQNIDEIIQIVQSNQF